MSHIQMLNGKLVDPTNLQASDIDIDDFAWGLANTGGFRCQSHQIYYNAQHACAVAVMLEIAGGSPELCLAGLHHDDAEVFVGDWPTPIKWLVPEVAELERKIMSVVARRWGFDELLLQHPELKRTDRFARGVEGWFLMGKPQWAMDYILDNLPDLRNVVTFVVGEHYPYTTLDQNGLMRLSQRVAFHEYKFLHEHYTKEMAG